VSVVRSDALRDELHANSRKEYDRLSWNNAADRLLDLYNHHRQAALA
jgi:glycosyltransferase involved in cell wall biosynthesis